MTMFGAIYHLLPGVVGFAWPFPKLARLQFWLSMIGIVLFVVPLAIGGVVQGMKLQDGIAFLEANQAALLWFRISTTGLLLVVLGNLLFALNVFALTAVWKLALAKNIIAGVKPALEIMPVAASLRGEEEVKA